MTDNRYETEVVRRVFDNQAEGAFISVGPDRDGNGVVEVSTDGSARSKEWYGEFVLALQPDHARAVAHAMLAAADDIDRASGKP